MLDPDYLEQAGNLVADIYSQIERDMLDHLSRKMLAGDISGQRATTALLLLSQDDGLALREILSKHRHELDAAVIATVEEALNRSDSDDLRRIKAGAGATLGGAAKTKQTAITVSGIKEILERDNLLMLKGASAAFLNASTWAVTQVNTGAMTTEKALHEAVRRLNKQGIPMITYRNTDTGMVTVRNHSDVAVRRHIRTQIRQAGDKLTDERLKESGAEFVEVSSHTGSRDSHALWQGQIYSLKGTRTMDGITYKDFYDSCMSGKLGDILGGPNCRHAKAPWFPGMPRRYSPNPKHPSGETNEDIYNWTQHQREHERNIRATKRDIFALEECLGSATGEEATRLQTELAAAKQNLRDQQKTLRDFVSEHDNVLQRSPRREWAGDSK